MDLDSVVHVQHRVTPFKVLLEVGCARGAFVPGLEGSWGCVPLTWKEGDVDAVCQIEGRIRDAPGPASDGSGVWFCTGAAIFPSMRSVVLDTWDTVK